MSTLPITKAGITKLRHELEHLKNVKRPEVITAISEARAHGDLKENAEYHAAREQQGFIEGRIKELEGVIGSSQVIDVASLNAGDKIVFGATVTLINVETDQETTYKIVGEYEADINQNQISITSPLARGLIGRMLGDIATINTPQSKVEYEITAVSYQ